MNAVSQKYVIQVTERLWNDGYGDLAMDVLFEHIPRLLRPVWLIRILRLAAEHIPPSDAIQGIVDLALSPITGRDMHPHPVIYAAADVAVNHPHATQRHVHMLARYVGKLVANAKNYPAPFDHNSLWEIPDVLVDLADELEQGDAFLEGVWTLLSVPEFITLAEPLMCNSGCPICLERYKHIYWRTV
jgi:hypothetical protein